MKILFKKRHLAAALVFLLVMAAYSVCFAGGIKVSPGAFTIQNVEPGKDLDLGIDLIITNKGSDEDVFVVRPLKPSQAVERWLKGYSEIPDANWFYFTRDRVKIGPDGEGKLRMHLKVPDEERYYNQRWIVYVEVTTESKEGKMFRMAIKPNYMIETAARRNVKDRPHGALGLSPGIVKAEKAVPGKRKKIKFRIYNNDRVKHTYKISSYIPMASKARQDISVSPGYEWVRDTDWVRPGKSRITLKPGKAKNVTLKVLIPKGSRYRDEGWESIVFIEPDEGPAGFVRVLIEPKE